MSQKSAMGTSSGSDLSQFSHRLSGRHRTEAGQPGQPADPDLRILILAHWLDGWHWRWPYRSRVVVMLACPMISWSIFGGYPAWIISEAAVCCRS